MCSQPPKDKGYSNLFSVYEQAVLLSDHGTRIGISGGEPTLHLDFLESLLHRVSNDRPDVSFHILSNAQHFSCCNPTTLQDVHQRIQVLWGVPIYSHNPDTHDLIVGKPNAFDEAMNGLYFLANTGASIELRTVVTARNALDLPQLSKFLSKNAPFIQKWAIMAMEPIGYAKVNRAELFFDHSIFPEPISAAVRLGELYGLNPELYNFPRCTVPISERRFCVDSISDWKQKYLSDCDFCSEKTLCCGFFEWYDPSWEWKNISAIQLE